tara:strand:- start:489700 stop:489987 length:288 start_codon:yes stop_codon:yes gene_type:complete
VEQRMLLISTDDHGIISVCSCNAHNRFRLEPELASRHRHLDCGIRFRVAKQTISNRKCNRIKGTTPRYSRITVTIATSILYTAQHSRFHDLDRSH